MRRRLVLCAILFSGALWASAAPAGACSYALPPGYDPVRDPFEASDIAVTGRVTRVVRRSPESTRFEATIRISRVYKGKTGPALRIRGGTEESSCGFGDIEQGQRIALLLHGRRTPFAVDLRSATSYRDLEKASGGRSHRPGRK